MSDLFETTASIVKALDHSREAGEYQQAADQGHGTPDTAAKAHWDAAGLIEGSLVRLSMLRERHVFEAKRMDREAQRERQSGVEYSRGDAA